MLSCSLGPGTTSFRTRVFTRGPRHKESPGFLVSIPNLTYSSSGGKAFLRPPNLENWFHCFYLCACNSASTSSSSFSSGMQCFVIRSLRLANWLERGEITGDEPALRVEIPLTTQSEMGWVRYRRQFLGPGLISIESLSEPAGPSWVEGNSFNICLTSRVGAHIPELEEVGIRSNTARARGCP